jgi:hypothetical protein
VPAGGHQAVLVHQGAIVAEAELAVDIGVRREPGVAEELDAGDALALQEREQPLETLVAAGGGRRREAGLGDAGDGVGCTRVPAARDVPAVVEHLHAQLAGLDTVTQLLGTLRGCAARAHEHHGAGRGGYRGATQRTAGNSPHAPPPLGVESLSQAERPCSCPGRYHRISPEVNRLL